MRPRGPGAAFLVVAFVLGGVEGALGFSLYQTWIAWLRPPEAGRYQQDVLRRLPKGLALRPEQREQVEAILRESGEDFARLREEIRPRFWEIRGRARERIKAVLNPEQQEKFQALEGEWERWVER